MSIRNLLFLGNTLLKPKAFVEVIGWAKFGGSPKPCNCPVCWAFGRLKRVLSRSPEGWGQRYQGCLGGMTLVVLLCLSDVGFGMFGVLAGAIPSMTVLLEVYN